MKTRVGLENLRVLLYKAKNYGLKKENMIPINIISMLKGVAIYYRYRIKCLFLD